MEEMILEEVEARFGMNARIIETCNEYGELRVVLKIPGVEYEQKYAVRDYGTYVTLEYRP